MFIQTVIGLMQARLVRKKGNPLCKTNRFFSKLINFIKIYQQTEDLQQKILRKPYKKGGLEVKNVFTSPLINLHKEKDQYQYTNNP